MDKETIKAIMEALEKGFRVELLRDKDGNIIVQTIQRKRLKTEHSTHALNVGRDGLNGAD